MFLLRIDDKGAIENARHDPLGKTLTSYELGEAAACGVAVALDLLPVDVDVRDAPLLEDLSDPTEADVIRGAPLTWCILAMHHAISSLVEGH
jgi:hypothetical protein